MATPQNLGDLIGAGADPDKLALIALGDPAEVNGAWVETRVTYGELDALANGVARALSRGGFKTGERIAILSANRAEYVAAFLGIMRAGLIAVPVNFKFPAALSNGIVPVQSKSADAPSTGTRFGPDFRKGTKPGFRKPISPLTSAKTRFWVGV